MHEQRRLHFPRSAGILLGLGLGGFFDGIVFHQLLRWHHMLSSWYPLDSRENFELNTLWDGLFHSATYLLVVAGLFILWRAARQPHFSWSTRSLVGTTLMGFGAFNLVEGAIDHHVLGIHHVNERVDVSQWLYWDLGFLLSGVVLLLAGWLTSRRASLGDHKGRPA